jgi:hypothetical protein
MVSNFAKVESQVDILRDWQICFDCTIVLQYCLSNLALRVAKRDGSSDLHDIQ